MFVPQPKCGEKPFQVHGARGNSSTAVILLSWRKKHSHPFGTPHKGDSLFSSCRCRVPDVTTQQLSHTGKNLHVTSTFFITEAPKATDNIPKSFKVNMSHQLHLTTHVPSHHIAEAESRNTPPTVEVGSSRIRICTCELHDKALKSEKSGGTIRGLHHQCQLNPPPISTIAA